MKIIWILILFFSFHKFIYSQQPHHTQKVQNNSGVEISNPAMEKSSNLSTPIGLEKKSVNIHKVDVQGRYMGPEQPLEKETHPNNTHEKGIERKKEEESNSLKKVPK
ncbi:MAG: hypothetical protein N2167_05690 [Flavobacteriales bacterium]|nr:hypothetical protein [Flavobacteriales bacterium]